jgi:hypothetical protein
VEFFGGEANTACISSMVMALVTYLELHCTLFSYLAIICPLNAVALAMLGVCLKSLVSKVAPKSSLHSVYATIDVLQNIAMLVVPFYRTVLFGMTQGDGQSIDDLLSRNINTIKTTGDPDPRYWLTISVWHWAIATCTIAYLLISESSQTDVARFKTAKLINDKPSPSRLVTKGKIKTK